MVILGDSHTRGCAAEVKQLLNNKFEVLGLVNSGSGMEFIKDTARVKLHQLKKNDVVVVWGGSNDIARNNSIKGMKNILEFVLNANHTNVIIMSAPHRHDLIRNSCVNKEVEAFNRKLCKRLKRFEKVKMIEVISERAFYTKYGQHLNTRGKEIMLKKTVATIECVLNRKVEPISVKWCNEEVTNNQEHQALPGKTDNNLEDSENKCGSTLGELNSHKEQNIHQESGGVTMLDTVKKITKKI
jgi:RNase P/RNase MRP subunit p30